MTEFDASARCLHVRLALQVADPDVAACRGKLHVVARGNADDKLRIGIAPVEPVRFEFAADVHVIALLIDGDVHVAIGPRVLRHVDCDTVPAAGCDLDVADVRLNRERSAGRDIDRPVHRRAGGGVNRGRGEESDGEHNSAAKHGDLLREFVRT